MQVKDGYLDIHTHILPGIDDGAKDWNMTMEMLQMAYQQGIRHIVATPHSYPEKKKQDAEFIKELVKDINIRAKQKMPDLDILLGNEIFYRQGIEKEIEKGEVFTLADSRYLLVEFLPGEDFRKICQGIYELTSAGYVPVIAHMERVKSLFYDEKNIWELIENGCLMQVNCGSLTGHVFDRKTIQLHRYIKRGIVHFIASDCHNLDTRCPVMQNCVKKLEKRIPETLLNRILIENPKLFLQKKYI